jgi:hypothetical protein
MVRFQLYTKLFPYFGFPHPQFSYIYFHIGRITTAFIPYADWAGLLSDAFILIFRMYITGTSVCSD